MAQSNAAAASEPTTQVRGERWAFRINSGWKGDFVADATAAAFQYGLLVSTSNLGIDRSLHLLRWHFDNRKVDEKYWSATYESFHCGRNSGITHAELVDRIDGPVPANDNQRFQATWFDDVDESAAKDEIVEGLIAAGEFSLWVAKPGTAKSVLLCDIGCHIAAGKEWHGKAVEQGLVVFFAAERKLLTERRVAAWRKTHGVAGAPFVIVGGKLDLTAGLIDAKALALAVRGYEEQSGLPCRLVILDTVTRTFGAGDQNSSKDMQRFIQSADELTRATGSHVAAIHHSGWAGDRGKGAIDLDGAVDVSYGISVSGKGVTKVFTLSCTGANDADEGVITSFRLDSVELGVDKKGKMKTAPVVVQVDAAKPTGSTFKGNSAKALDALKLAIQEHGICAPDGSPGFPDDVPTVSRDEWRDQFYAAVRAKAPDIKDATLRQRFLRAKTELIDAEQVGATGERCWISAT